MLTNRGRLPFAEAYPEKVTINALNEGVQKRAAGESFPEPQLASDELKKIIAKACAFKPNERYFTPEQMLSDLTNALNNKPFEEAQYNDVYSVSAKDYDIPEENILIPEVEDFHKEPEQETQVVSLRQEIKIPEIVPTYVKEAEPKKKQVRYEKLPEIKKKKRRNKEMENRILTMLIITVILFILMIVSIVLHASGDDTTVESIAGVINNYYFMLSGGGLLNGC
jgi:hypothetical protein